ncbi:MAG: hypothetical protein E5X65_20720 [Mesorhizobium sp.]|nr:MAG: hypothetical protein E5X65_20720 [Mesorhizobium sp.]
MPCPQRGVYFFFEPGEARSQSGQGPRVVRVGTHGLTAESKTTLRGRLSQHRGTLSAGSGNHRGSVFRLLVGSALMQRQPEIAVESWGRGGNAPREVRLLENAAERAVTHHMLTLTFLALNVPDEPGRDSIRGFIERNAIALLSNYSCDPVDPPSADWLGHHCPRETVRRSGLWNQNHVQENCDLRFLDKIDRLAASPTR